MTLEDTIREAVREVIREELPRLLATNGPALLTIAEAADRAGVSVATIRRRIRDGAIVPTRLGLRSIRIPAEAIRPGGEDVEEAHAVRFPRAALPR